jgi:hypothetical protein
MGGTYVYNNVAHSLAQTKLLHQSSTWVPMDDEFVCGFFFVPLPIFWVEFGGWCQVDLCFDQLVFKLSEQMFSHYKSLAARYK